MRCLGPQTFTAISKISRKTNWVVFSKTPSAVPPKASTTSAAYTDRVGVQDWQYRNLLRWNFKLKLPRIVVLGYSRARGFGASLGQEAAVRAMIRAHASRTLSTGIS